MSFILLHFSGGRFSICWPIKCFKIVTSLGADDFGKWEESEFAPEGKLIEALKAIDGVSLVETQTYTLMPM